MVRGEIVGLGLLMALSFGPWIVLNDESWRTSTNVLSLIGAFIFIYGIVVKGEY